MPHTIVETNGDNQRVSASNGTKLPNSTVASQDLYARDGVSV